MRHLSSKLILSLLGATALSLAALPHSADAAVTVHDTDYGAVTYTAFDLDNDGMIEENEYIQTGYDLADIDNDGIVEEYEWETYTSYYIDPYDNDYETYTYYDIDDNDYLDEDEFTVLYDDLDYFAALDTDGDGFIEEYEYVDALDTYRTFDYDYND